MAKGKKKTLTVERHRNKVKGEAKENNHEMKMSCPIQSTGQTSVSPENPRSPHRNTPLFPINEENSPTCTTTDTSKPEEVRLAVEVCSTQERNVSLIAPKKKTPQEEGLTSGAAIPNKCAYGTSVKAKMNKMTHKTLENKNSQHNRKVTDYYPIRRSSRKSKAEMKSEEQQHIDDLITNGVEDGLKVKQIEGKGRGVFADRDFHKGQFVVEYHGDLLHTADAKKREAQYAQDPSKGCYMYYFSYLNKNYCVDATKETDRLGRLINHSKNGNCQTRLHDLNGVPHLILVASRNIKADEELLYDYGDRSKEAIAAHPWLKQ